MEAMKAERESFERIISQLPFPIAFRCRFILTRIDKRSALESIIDAYEALVKFLALTVISDYLRGLVTSETLDNQLKSLFSSRIAPGKWLEILRETLRIYVESPGKTFMPELFEFYFLKKKLTLEAKKFERWVKRRNNFRGHSKRLITDDLVEETWNRWWPEFKELIATFSFLTSYEMIIPAFIRRNRIEKAHICSGPDQFFLFDDSYNMPLSIKGVEAEESLILVDKRNPVRQLLLYPFLVVKAPADLYLFEQGERRKGTLDRVVFASLGPGDALEIRRKDKNRRIIEDLEKKLERLGEIGICLDGIDLDALLQSPEVVLIEEATRMADYWSKAGYPYHLVETISDKLKAFLNHPSEDVEIDDKGTHHFLMVASIHFGRNWFYWLDKAGKDAKSAAHLIRILIIAYIRPRLRALYALQQIPRKEVEKALEDYPEKIPQEISGLLRKYPLRSAVMEYIKKIIEGPDPELRKKAASVMREIERYTGKTYGKKTISGLPLI